MAKQHRSDSTRKKILSEYESAREAAEIFNSGATVEYLRFTIESLRGRIEGLNKGYDYWNSTTPPDKSNVGKNNYLELRRKKFEDHVGISKLNLQANGLERVIRYIENKFVK